MKILEMIEAVESFYAPGCIEFYQSQRYDPWAKAILILEESIGKDEDTLSAALERHVETCKSLVAKFRDVSEPQKEMTILTAFMSGSEDNFKKVQSKMKNQCYECETKKDLTLFRDDKNKVVVVCKKCLSEL